MRRFTVLFAAICDFSSFVATFPLESRDEALDALEKLTRRLNKTGAKKLFHALRSDNDTVFRGKEWKKLVDRLGLDHSFSTPYLPTGNPTIERFFSTLGDCLRRILLHTDPRLWCYAVEHLAWLWNRRPIHKNSILDGCCPHEIMVATKAASRELADNDTRYAYLSL
jgi:hypothetical protein